MNGKEDKIVFCKGGGCTAKLGAGLLSHVLEKLPKGPADENLLVGYDSKDDAAVYRISEDTAVVQTLDFFSSHGGRSLYLRKDSGHECFE